MAFCWPSVSELVKGREGRKVGTDGRQQSCSNNRTVSAQCQSAGFEPCCCSDHLQVPRECHKSAVAVLQLPGLGIWKGQGEVCVLWGGLSVQQHRSIPS